MRNLSNLRWPFLDDIRHSPHPILRGLRLLTTPLRNARTIRATPWHDLGNRAFLNTFLPATTVRLVAVFIGGPLRGSANRREAELRPLESRNRQIVDN